MLKNTNNEELLKEIKNKESENIYLVDEQYFTSKENEENNVLLGVKNGKKIQLSLWNL